jgi:hypothetical protein
MPDLTSIGAITSRSTALAGGSIDSSLIHVPLPDNYLGFTSEPVVDLVPLLGKEGPQKHPGIIRSWIWNNDVPLVDTLSNAIDASALTTTLTVANPQYYQVGAQITIDTENMSVTGRGTGVIYVERAAQGSTIASHSAAAPVFIAAPAVAENADDAEAPFSQGDKDYNAYQTVTMAWPMSHRAETVVSEEFPNGGWFNTILKNALDREIPRRLEMALFKNLRSVGTGVTASTFGGFREPTFISTRTAVSGILTETHINDALAGVDALNTRRPTIAMGSPTVGRILSSAYAGARWITGDATSVTNYVDSFNTPFGMIKFVPNRNMATWAPDKLYFFDPKDIKQSPYDSSSNWQTGLYETQGWHKRQYVRGDITYTFPFADSRVELYGFSVNPAFYSGYA